MKGNPSRGTADADLAGGGLVQKLSTQHSEWGNIMATPPTTASTGRKGAKLARMGTDALMLLAGASVLGLAGALSKKRRQD